MGIAACLALGVAGYAAKGVGGTTSLKGTFRDLGANFFATNADRIMSDCRLGDTADPRCPYVDKENGIRHSIAPGGGYVLEDTANGTRTVQFDFGDCASPGECTPPFSVPTRIDVTKLSTDDSVGALAVGAQSANVTAQWIIFSAIDPADGKDKVWFIRFKTEFKAESAQKCIGSSTIIARHPDANSWEVEAEPGDIACLLSQTCPRCPYEYHGKYHLPFKIISVRK